MNYNKRKIIDICYGYNNDKNDKKKHKKTDDTSSTNSDEDESLFGKLKIGLSKKDSDIKIERDNNHIYFYSEVDRESIYELTMLIKEAEEESIITSHKLNIEKIPIYIHISSNGGSIFSAFTAIDVINSCKVPVYTIIEGATASAGTLISIVGNKRYIRPNAYMLIHQLSSCCWGKMSEIEDEFKNLQEITEKIKKMYKDNTNIPKKELNELLKHDLWLNVEKCTKYKLVDEIWNQLS